MATVLALICTEPDVDEIELDGQRLYAKRGPRRLPQGAPTSPAMTNLICLRLDQRLSGLAAKLGFTYTRYADDMTFSASGEPAKKAGALLKFVGEIVTAEGFTVHPDKTRVMRCHRRQEVTGLTVNERIAVPRDTLRRFRALLHRIETTGPEGKRWGRGGNVLLSAAGFARFVQMVDAQGRRVPGGACRYAGGTPRRRTALPCLSAATFRAKAAAGLQPLESWWHPAERPGPQPEPVLAAHLAPRPNGTAAAPAPSSTAGTGPPSALPPAEGSRPAAAPRQQPGAKPSLPRSPVRCGGRCWSWRHWAPRCTRTAGWRHAGGCAGRRNRALSLVAAEGVNGAAQPRHRLTHAGVSVKKTRGDEADGKFIAALPRTKSMNARLPRMKGRSARYVTSDRSYRG